MRSCWSRNERSFRRQDPVNGVPVQSAPDWAWATTGEVTTVELESEMTAAGRDRAVVGTHFVVG